MKYKPTQWLALLIMAGIVWGCEQNTSNITPPIENELITEAHQFYLNDFIPPEPNLKSGNDNNFRHSLFKELQWDMAYLRPMADGNQAVIIPLLHEQELYPNKNNSRYSLNQLSNIMMYPNAQGSFNLEVVTTLPDSVFFAGGTFGKAFTGVVLVEDWSGELLKSIKYTQDSIIAKDHQSLKRTPSLKTKYYSCIITTDWYTCHTDDDSNTICRYEGTTTESDICESSGGADDPTVINEIVYNYPPGTGSGSVNTTTPESPIKDLVDTLFNLDSVPDSIQIILMKDLERVELNCVGKFILDALSGANGLLDFSANINIVYDPNATYTQYDPLTNTLRLSEVINFFGESMLIHELSHAMQDALYSNSVINKSVTPPFYEGRCQIELEAHVIEDLSRGGNTYKKYKYFSYNYNIKENYNQFMTDLKNNNPDIEKFNSFLGPFVEHYPKYGVLPNTNFTPSLFQLAYQNCKD